MSLATLFPKETLESTKQDVNDQVASYLCSAVRSASPPVDPRKAGMYLRAVQGLWSSVIVHSKLSAKMLSLDSYRPTKPDEMH